nr:S-formylglutathione hydrolase-like [Chrysemys picta bellii]
MLRAALLAPPRFRLLRHRGPPAPASPPPAPEVPYFCIKIERSQPAEIMALKQISSNKCFEGFQKVFEHDSIELKCKMRFGIYLPPKAEIGKCPVLYWLSGLTCTEQNFITKSGFHQAAAEHGLIVVAPDTSPRKCLQVS